ncbi:murein L,D-transpeptidase catalytic domain family protein [Flavitalea flava]
MCRYLLKPVFWCVLVAFLGSAMEGKALGTGPLAGGHKNAEKAAFAEEVTLLYDQINLKDLGLTKKAFEYALRGYNYMLEHHWLNKTNLLSICDLSQSSCNKRLYVVDLEKREVIVNTYVAHGRNSGSEFAHSFSNNPSSHKTSLGFYVTQGTYYGNNGLSLKIRGLERGFNDRANGRNIVIHGSEYVGSDFLQMNRFCGRSYGCPAIPSDETEKVIDLIKEGSCLFIYHPNKKYISRSKILNS